MPIHDWTRVNAGIFYHFHATWIVEIAKALNGGILPADYYAMAEQMAGEVGPDVLTLQSTRPDDEEVPAEPSGGIAVAAAPPKVRFTTEFEIDAYARKRRTVVIHHTSDDRIIAMIEILSAGNKASRHALRSFLDKAMRSGCHLLLVDLFPPGPRDPEGIHGALCAEYLEDGFTLPREKPLTLAAYSAGEVKRAYVETVAVGDVLPDMPLFLTPGTYVPVPLEATYLAAWEAVPRRWRDRLQPPPSGAAP